MSDNGGHDHENETGKKPDNLGYNDLFPQYCHNAGVLRYIQRNICRQDSI